MLTRASLAVAPADRSPGDRGFRGRIATLSVLGAVVALGFRHGGGSSSGAGGSGIWSFRYSLRTGAGPATGLAIAAGLLLAGGTALWLARGGRRTLLAAAVALAGVTVLALSLAAPGDRPLSAAVYGAVESGELQSVLTARLGEPASTDASAVPAGGGARLGCLVYRARPDPARGLSVYLLCLRNGRLRAKLGV